MAFMAMMAEGTKFKLLDSLPIGSIHADQADVHLLEKDPKFGELLCTIDRQKNETSNTLQEKVKMAQDTLQKSKKFYMEQWIMYNILNKVTLLKGHDETTHLIQEYLTRVGLANSLQLCEGVHLLGLTPESVLDLPPVNKMDIQNNVVPLLATELEEQFLKVNAMLGLERSDHLEPALTNFEDVLKGKLKAVNEGKEMLAKEKMQVQRASQKYIKTLLEVMHLLVNFLTNYQPKALMQQKTLLENILVEDKACKLKAEKTQRALLAKTYTTETVKALKIIRNELHKQSESLQSRLSKMTSLLQMYEELGPAFQEIAQEYKSVEKQIESGEEISKTLGNLK